MMKTGVHPMRVRLKLFFKWGIEFDKDHPYTVSEHGNRKVQYANKSELMDGIIQKYPPEALPDGTVDSEGGGMSGITLRQETEQASSKRTQSRNRQPKPLPQSGGKGEKSGGGTLLSQEQTIANPVMDAADMKQEVRANG